MDPGIGKKKTLIREVVEPTHLNEGREVAPDTPILGAPIERAYKIIDVRGGHGISGMGIVYILEDQGQRYAVKTFQRRFAQRLDYIQRFIREAKTWMLIGFHPNIAHAYRLDLFEAVPHLFIEYIPSDDAGRHTLAHYLKDGPLAPRQVLDFAVQFCDGMIHATSAVDGLVHRDIKPDNLLITPEGRLKVTDFGLVRGSRTDTLPDTSQLEEKESTYELPLTHAGAFFGTPAYMAPEQFDDAAEVGSTADIYAFGCCMYEALAGKPPFVAEHATTFEQLMLLKRKHLTAPPPKLTDCPPPIADVVARCLEKDPRDRWPDFASLKQAVAEAMKACFHTTPLAAPLSDALPRLIAEQSRSLILLDGYEKAIERKYLRQEQGHRPYDFHLALASYFRYNGDQDEHERQLRKALEARSAETGYEAVRQLAEALLLRNQLEEAALLLNGFLTQNPGGEQFVIEPLVRLACAEGRFDAAQAWLDASSDSIRTTILRAELLRAKGSLCELVTLLDQTANTTLDHIETWLSRVKPDDTVGWEREEDPQTLLTMLTELRPNLDVSILKETKAVIWPNLTGYPDFAPPMTLLSEVFGELAQLETECEEESAQCYATFARLLGYPKRLKRHLEREEEWFWTRGGIQS